MATSGSILGNPVRRREDPGILTGRTEYFDDLAGRGPAARRVRAVDDRPRRASRRSTRATRSAMPGVVAVYTADDLDLPDHHGFMMLPPTMNRPPLAREQGALRRRHRRDGRRRDEGAGDRRGRDRDRRLRPAARGRRPRSRDRSPTRRSCSRRRDRTSPTRMGTGPVEGVLDDADVVVSRSASSTSASRRCRWSRAASSRCPASPPAASRSGSRRRARTACATSSRRSSGSIPRSCAARNAAVGGGFGAKPGMIVEHLLVAQGRADARPAGEVDRDPLREHGRDVARPRPRCTTSSSGLKRDGTITGLRVRTIADAGAYPAIGAFLPFFTQMMAQNVYVDPEGRVQLAGRGHEHHAGRRVPRRGPARGDPPHGAHPRHRRRRARHRSGRDPAQELHPARGVPVHDRSPVSARPTTPASTTRRSTRVLEHAGYDALRAEQKARRERGDTKLLGIGVASYLEISAPLAFNRGVRRGRDRRRRHGDRARRHERARPGSRDRVREIVSDALGVPMEDVRVVHSDTDEVAARRRHRRVALAARSAAARCSSRARRCSRRRSSSPRTCSRRAPTTS